MAHVVIVGGGPGGLMTARLLERRVGGDLEITLLEAGDRTGGKLHTRAFATGSVPYESGIAECYDFEAFGPDPLKALVRELGLTPAPASGHVVVLNDRFIRTDDDLGRMFGSTAQAEVRAFRAEAISAWGPREWAQPASRRPAHPWSCQPWASRVNALRDDAASRYVQALAHSDIASEPHLVDGETGLRNFLKSVPGYGAQYRIQGGMGQLGSRLAATLRQTRIQLRSPVVAVAGDDSRGYHVIAGQPGEHRALACDAVVAALPYPCLRRLHWQDDGLRAAIATHVQAFDHPAHYLRVALLFDQPFWRDTFSDAFLMLDAFGGCCLYDESPGEAAADGAGVLGCLLAGADALALSNLDDDELVRLVRAALPSAWQAKVRSGFLEGRVRRWAGSLSARPGAVSRVPLDLRHCPEPDGHAGVLLVGDHQLDATLNGLWQSAELVTERLVDRLRTRPGWSSGRLPLFQGHANELAAGAHAGLCEERL